MDCKFYDVVRDNHGQLVAICLCRESENFLHEISVAFDNCDFGIVDDYGEEAEKGGE
ncbi:MAG: hypothetical protein IJW16_02110 [Clostridia bacterium]|nr:hypothetical protein [Clostridia bacterium]